MTKIITVGDRNEILKKKQHKTEGDSFKGMKGTQVETWCKNTFSELPEKAQEGINTIALALWAKLQEDKR